MFTLGVILSVVAFVLDFGPCVKWAESQLPICLRRAWQPALAIVFIIGVVLSCYQHILDVKTDATVIAQLQNAQKTIRQLSVRADFIISGEWSSGSAVEGTLTNPGQGIPYLRVYISDDIIRFAVTQADVKRVDGALSHVSYDASPLADSKIYSMTIDSLHNISRIKAVVLPTVPGTETLLDVIEVRECTTRLTANGTTYAPLTRQFRPLIVLPRGRVIDLSVDPGELLTHTNSH